MNVQSLALAFCMARSQDPIEYDTILQVQVDVADMVMQAEQVGKGYGEMALSIDSDGDVSDPDLEQAHLSPDPEPPLPLDVPNVPDEPDLPDVPCNNTVDPPPAGCPPPDTAFKVCAMFGDPHLSETFKGRTYTAEDRGEDKVHTNLSGILTNHYGHGLFDIFKSNDHNIHVQGFFCPVTGVNPMGNSLNMAVAKIGNNRIVWKRPQETLKKGPYNCDVLTYGHEYYMWMYVNGYRIHHQDIPHTGFSNSFMWAEKLNLDKEHWPWGGMEQRNLCVGTHDRKLTIKMAVPPAECAWMPSMVMELAEDLVDYSPTSICSLQKRDGTRSTLDPVPWAESLFKMDEMLDMCTGCGLMPADELGVFSGCNPPAAPDFSGKEFCEEMNKSSADMEPCDRFDDADWKDACLVEICSMPGGDAETEVFLGGGDPLMTTEALLAGRYSVQYHHLADSKKYLQSYEITIACDDSVSSPENPESFVNAHVAYELVPEKCKETLQENRSATMWIANTNHGLYACVAKVADAANLTLTGRFYLVQSPTAVKALKYVEYTKLEAYKCSCSHACTACSTSSTCVSCSYGYELVTDVAGTHCEKQ